MIEIVLTETVKARLWYGDVPFAYTPEKLDEYEIRNSFRSIHEKRNLTIELLKYIGPRISYALLGIEFEESAQKFLNLRVGTISQQSQSYTSALILPYDRAWIGLLDEYSQSVFDGAVSAIQRMKVTPPGIVRITCAAHSEVGSSSEAFRRLSYILFAFALWEEKGLPVTTNSKSILTLLEKESCSLDS